MEPMEAAKTPPNPIAKGPPMYKNLSLGAQTATVERPPTIPAVYLKFNKTNEQSNNGEKGSVIYRAALSSRGPPK